MGKNRNNRRFNYQKSPQTNAAPKERMDEVRQQFQGYKSVFGRTPMTERERRIEEDIERYLEEDDNPPSYKNNRREERPEKQPRQTVHISEVKGLNARPGRSFGEDDNPFASMPEAEPLRVVTTEDDQSDVIVHQDEYDYLNDFLCDYTSDDVKKSYTKQKELIHDHILDLSKILSNYLNPKYADIADLMNAALQLMVTDTFANGLYSVLVESVRNGEDDGTFDNWDTDYEYLGQLVSILIGCKRREMTDETETLYVTKIAKGIWTQEIRQLVGKTHITESLATDLVLRTPVAPQNMKDYHIERFYKGFLDSMLIHAEDNVEVLDRGTQGMIFNFLYGKDRNAAKAIGRHLADAPREEFPSSLSKMVYTEFKCMLYDKLNTFDIGVIKFVLKFIVGQKKNGKTNVIFDLNTAADYPNINKALQSYIRDDQDAKDCLSL